jgi:hypothetical protein
MVGPVPLEAPWNYPIIHINNVTIGLRMWLWRQLYCGLLLESKVDSNLSFFGRPSSTSIAFESGPMHHKQDWGCENKRSQNNCEKGWNLVSNLLLCHLAWKFSKHVSFLIGIHMIFVNITLQKISTNKKYILPFFGFIWFIQNKTRGTWHDNIIVITNL